MKNIKRLDILINLSLISWFLIQQCWTDLEKMTLAYFTVGVWQVISMLLHAWLGWFNKPGSARRIYHWITFISVIAIPAGSFWILAVTAPLMAVFYSGLCIAEFFKIRNRPLSLLK